MSELITQNKLISDLKNIGIKKGDLLHLKVSMRAIGKIDGGANTLIEALLTAVGEQGTIVIDAFINSYALPLSDEDAKKTATDQSLSYAGALANSMIKHAKGKRSKHQYKNLQQSVHRPRNFAIIILTSLVVTIYYLKWLN